MLTESHGQWQVALVAGGFGRDRAKFKEHSEETAREFVADWNKQYRGTGWWAQALNKEELDRRLIELEIES